MNYNSILSGILALGVFSQILSIAIVVFYLVAGWKLLQKGEIAGWKILIPIYGTYCLFKVARSEGIFWGIIILNVVSSLLLYAIATASPQVAMFFSLALGVAEIYLIWKYSANMADAFGKGTGFAVGLLLLSWIFIPILAFGSAEYQYGTHTPVYNHTQRGTGGSTLSSGGEYGSTVRNLSGGQAQTIAMQQPACAMKVRLIYSGMYMDKIVHLSEGEKTYIGRGEVQIQTNPGDGMVSHKHGVFAVRGGMVTYTDNSSNGTRYNGQKMLRKGESVNIPFDQKVQLEIGNHRVLIIARRN